MDKLTKDIEKLIKKYNTRYGDKGYKLDILRVRMLNLNTLKLLLQETNNINPQVLIASNGLFTQSDNMHLTIKDTFELHHGLHNLVSLGDDECHVDTSIIDWPVFPTVVVFDHITVNRDKELMLLKLPFVPLNLLRILLDKYNINKEIKLYVNDDYAEFNSDKFNMIIKGSWV